MADKTRTSSAPGGEPPQSGQNIDAERKRRLFFVKSDLNEKFTPQTIAAQIAAEERSVSGLSHIFDVTSTVRAATGAGSRSIRESGGKQVDTKQHGHVIAVARVLKQMIETLPDPDGDTKLIAGIRAYVVHTFIADNLGFNSIVQRILNEYLNGTLGSDQLEKRIIHDLVQQSKTEGIPVLLFKGVRDSTLQPSEFLSSQSSAAWPRETRPAGTPIGIGQPGRPVEPEKLTGDGLEGNTHATEAREHAAHRMVNLVARDANNLHFTQVADIDRLLDIIRTILTNSSESPMAVQLGLERIIERLGPLGGTIIIGAREGRRGKEGTVGEYLRKNLGTVLKLVTAVEVNSKISTLRAVFGVARSDLTKEVLFPRNKQPYTGAVIKPYEGDNEVEVLELPPRLTPANETPVDHILIETRGAKSDNAEPSVLYYGLPDGSNGGVGGPPEQRTALDVPVPVFSVPDSSSSVVSGKIPPSLPPPEASVGSGDSDPEIDFSGIGGEASKVIEAVNGGAHVDALGPDATPDERRAYFERVKAAQILFAPKRTTESAEHVAANPAAQILAKLDGLMRGIRTRIQTINSSPDSESERVRIAVAYRDILVRIRVLFSYRTECEKLLKDEDVSALAHTIDENTQECLDAINGMIGRYQMRARLIAGGTIDNHAIEEIRDLWRELISLKVEARRTERKEAGEKTPIVISAGDSSNGFIDRDIDSGTVLKLATGMSTILDRFDEAIEEVRNHLGQVKQKLGGQTTPMPGQLPVQETMPMGSRDPEAVIAPIPVLPHGQLQPKSRQFPVSMPPLPPEVTMPMVSQEPERVPIVPGSRGRDLNRLFGDGEPSAEAMASVDRWSADLITGDFHGALPVVSHEMADVPPVVRDKSATTSQVMAALILPGTSGITRAAPPPMPVEDVYRSLNELKALRLESDTTPTSPAPLSVSHAAIRDVLGHDIRISRDQSMPPLPAPVQADAASLTTRLQPQVVDMSVPDTVEDRRIAMITHRDRVVAIDQALKRGAEASQELMYELAEHVHAVDIMAAAADDYDLHEDDNPNLTKDVLTLVHKVQDTVTPRLDYEFSHTLSSLRTVVTNTEDAQRVVDYLTALYDRLPDDLRARYAETMRAARAYPELLRKIYTSSASTAKGQPRPRPLQETELSGKLLFPELLSFDGAGTSSANNVPIEPAFTGGMVSEATAASHREKMAAIGAKVRAKAEAEVVPLALPIAAPLSRDEMAEQLAGRIPENFSKAYRKIIVAIQRFNERTYSSEAEMDVDATRVAGYILEYETRLETIDSPAQRRDAERLIVDMNRLLGEVRNHKRQELVLASTGEHSAGMPAMVAQGITALGHETDRFAEAHFESIDELDEAYGHLQSADVDLFLTQELEKITHPVARNTLTRDLKRAVARLEDVYFEQLKKVRSVQPSVSAEAVSAVAGDAAPALDVLDKITAGRDMWEQIQPAPLERRADARFEVPTLASKENDENSVDVQDENGRIVADLTEAAKRLSLDAQQTFDAIPLMLGEIDATTLPRVQRMRQDLANYERLATNYADAARDLYATLTPTFAEPLAARMSGLARVKNDIPQLCRLADETIDANRDLVEVPYYTQQLDEVVEDAQALAGYTGVINATTVERAGALAKRAADAVAGLSPHQYDRAAVDGKLEIILKTITRVKSAERDSHDDYVVPPTVGGVEDDVMVSDTSSRPLGRRTAVTPAPIAFPSTMGAPVLSAAAVEDNAKADAVLRDLREFETQPPARVAPVRTTLPPEGVPEQGVFDEDGVFASVHVPPVTSEDPRRWEMDDDGVAFGDELFEPDAPGEAPSELDIDALDAVPSSVSEFSGGEDLLPGLAELPADGPQPESPAATVAAAQSFELAPGGLKDLSEPISEPTILDHLAAVRAPVEANVEPVTGGDAPPPAAVHIERPTQPVRSGDLGERTDGWELPGEVLATTSATDTRRFDLADHFDERRRSSAPPPVAAPEIETELGADAEPDRAEVVGLETVMRQEAATAAPSRALPETPLARPVPAVAHNEERGEDDESDDGVPVVDLVPFAVTGSAPAAAPVSSPAAVTAPSRALPETPRARPMPASPVSARVAQEEPATETTAPNSIIVDGSITGVEVREETPGTLAADGHSRPTAPTFINRAITQPLRPVVPVEAASDLSDPATATAEQRVAGAEAAAAAKETEAVVLDFSSDTATAVDASAPGAVDFADSGLPSFEAEAASVAASAVSLPTPEPIASRTSSTGSAPSPLPNAGLSAPSLVTEPERERSARMYGRAVRNGLIAGFLIVAGAITANTVYQKIFGEGDNRTPAADRASATPETPVAQAPSAAPQNTPPAPSASPSEAPSQAVAQASPSAAAQGPTTNIDFDLTFQKPLSRASEQVSTGYRNIRDTLSDIGAKLEKLNIPAPASAAPEAPASFAAAQPSQPATAPGVDFPNLVNAPMSGPASPTVVTSAAEAPAAGPISAAVAVAKGAPVAVAQNEPARTARIAATPDGASDHISAAHAPVSNEYQSKLRNTAEALGNHTLRAPTVNEALTGPFRFMDDVHGSLIGLSPDVQPESAPTNFTKYEVQKGEGLTHVMYRALVDNVLSNMRSKGMIITPKIEMLAEQSVKSHFRTPEQAYQLLALQLAESPNSELAKKLDYKGAYLQLGGNFQLIGTDLGLGVNRMQSDFAAATNQIQSSVEKQLDKKSGGFGKFLRGIFGR